jgi:hypothetical protein
MKRAVALTLLFGIPSMSSAQQKVSFTLTPVPLPFLSPEQNLKGFCACQIDMHTTDGSLITALDVDFEGRFHQRWVDPDLDGFDPTPRGASFDRRGDSHLTPVPGALTGIPPVDENNNQFSSPLPDSAEFDYGVGTFLRGAWGIPRASQSTTASVAYLVMPRDNRNLYFGLDYAVATSSGVFNGSYGHRLDIDLEEVLCIPEPTTLAICSLGLLLLTTRRTRTSTFIPLSKRNLS